MGGVIRHSDLLLRLDEYFIILLRDYNNYYYDVLARKQIIIVM